MKEKENEIIEEQVVVEETPEAPVEEKEPEIAEEKPIARSRAFIMAKHPEKTYENEEDYESDLADYLENSEKDLEAYRKSDKELEEILDVNPELALMVKDMRRGVPFAVALQRYVDLEELAPIEGEPDYEAYEEAMKKRKADNATRKERESMLAKNAEQSAKDIAEYLGAKGWNEDQQANFDKWFGDLVAKLSENKLGKDEMDVFVKGYEYDEAVARAEEKGKVSGRNEKIETKRKVSENVDDLPEAGASTKVESNNPRQRQVFDINKLLGK